MDELDTDETALACTEVFDANGDAVVTLRGELDISNAPSFRTTVQGVLDAKPRRIVFDVEALTFLDSSGIAVLVHAANNVDDVDLRHPSEIIRRIVEATGLSEVLRLDPR